MWQWLLLPEPLTQSKPLASSRMSFLFSNVTASFVTELTRPKLDWTYEVPKAYSWAVSPGPPS